MSLSEIRNAVLLFSNPVWSGASTVPTTIIRNLTALSSQVAYEERIDSNITTLTTTNAHTLDGTIEGLLYVPDIRAHPACDTLQYDFMAPNVTRRRNLPPTNYNLIALAPWFSIDCTQAYLASARLDPTRGFIFFKPNNSSNKPQDVDAPLWNLEDGGAWRNANPFPIFAVSGAEGQRMITQLSLYSGNVSEVPHSDQINQIYGPNDKDYVRIWTELDLRNPSNMPALWSFFLIVIGALLLIIASVSLTMHFIQRRRRKALQHRVEIGEVDLEASGVKQLTVPAAHVKGFPLFTFNAEPDLISSPQTPIAAGSPMSPRSVRSRGTRRQDTRSTISGPTRSVVSKRSSLTGSVDTTATNHQPACHICLTMFDHRITIIRELPCGHIFHPECIDEFLMQNSSLCPMCKHCMLPRGCSPKITNAMVRRERALRRLRARVDLDDASLESGDTKLKSWGKRLFSLSSTSAASAEIPMTNVKANDQPRTSERAITSPSTGDVPEAATTPRDAAASSEMPDEAITTVPRRAKPPRPRKQKPRTLRLLPTQPEHSELSTAAVPRRGSPSSFARERMREFAARNAPFDDPDGQRPKWIRAVTHVFPGFH